MSYTSSMPSDICNSVVLVRVCFDLPDLSHLARVNDAIPTIRQLFSQGNKVILVSHWGRPDGQIDPKFSFRRALGQLQSQINRQLHQHGFKPEISLELVDQTDPSSDFQAIRNYINSSSERLFLLENTRFIAAEQSKNETDRQTLATK